MNKLSKNVIYVTCDACSTRFNEKTVTVKTITTDELKRTVIEFDCPVCNIVVSSFRS